MRIAILSDIHDNIWKLEAALQQLEGAEALICCGDLCSPFIAKQLGEGFSGPIHIVFGNNDGDLFRISQVARNFGQITLHGEFADLTLGGKRFAVNHFDAIGRAVAASGAYDVVCYGHNHQYEVVRENGTLRINPGEIMGGLSGVSTFVLYDTDTDEAARHEV